MLASEALAKYRTKAAAARALNIPVNTFKSRLDREARLSKQEELKRRAGSLQFPFLPEKEEPIEELLSRCEAAYKRGKNHRDASIWQQVQVNEILPIGIAALGDPHVDDPGCNLPALRQDVKIVASTPGCYGLNIGDSTNNWIGRLARLYANQDTSITSARRLAEWLLTGTNINWLVVLLGNHDMWGDGGEIIQRICAVSKVHIPVHEWQAKIELVFPNKATCRITAAHDFKGRSQYTPLHGLKKEAIWQQDGTDIAIGGHIHFGGIEQCELPGGHSPWLVRVRGYKELDQFAVVNGFHEGRRFASAMIIVDPLAPKHERVLVFGSLAQGAAILTALREQRAAEQASARSRGSDRRVARPSSKRRPDLSKDQKRSRKRPASSTNHRPDRRRAGETIQRKKSR